MKVYAWILGLTLAMLSMRVFAVAPTLSNPCVDVAMAMASEAVNGQPTNPILSHTQEVDKEAVDYVYLIDVVGGQSGQVQNVATTVRVYFRNGVAFCG